MEKMLRPLLIFLSCSHQFHVYSDAFFHELDAALEEEQAGAFKKPIGSISRATLDLDRLWTPLDLESDSIVYALTHLRGYL